MPHVFKYSKRSNGKCFMYLFDGAMETKNFRNCFMLIDDDTGIIVPF